jgi:predicted Zn-dependent protease
MNQEFPGAIVDQPAYYKKIDDMVFGRDPREGYFNGTRFLHPGMRFVLEFPEGYQSANQRNSVQGVSDAQDAVVQLSLSGAVTPELGLQAFLAQQGMNAAGNGLKQVHGLPTASDTFSVASQNGTVRGIVAFVQYDGHLFQLLGYSTDAAWPGREADLRASLSSFDQLTDPAALRAQPKHVTIVNPAQALSFDNLASSFGATVDVATLALINQLEADTRLQAGRPYKVVTGGTD